jgi:EmrB/QacA subfamily drug resistance transporter
MDRKWWTLIAVCIGTFMLLIDVTIVNVALPDIQTSLKSSFSDLQWVVDAYSLMLAALLLTTGSLADLFGRRRVFVLGLCIFTASSLLSGLATTPLFLNLARGAQGVGAAAMFSTSLALLASSFRGRERGMAFGVWGTITGLAVAIGPVVGGALTTGFGWRWIFLVNVPIGVIGVIVTLLRVEESRQPGARRPDWLGALTFSGALAALVYALIQGESKGWTSNEILGCLVGAGILLLAFLILELVQAAPMFDLSLFRNPTFAGGSIVAFSLSAGMFALLLYLTLYLQDVLGFSALETGERLLFLSGGILLTSTLAGRLTTRVPIRLLIGPGLILVGVGLMLMRGLNPSSSWQHLIPGFVVGGAGVGLINPPLASTAVGVVEPARAGMASGINSTFRQVGIATGIAGLGAIFSHSVRVKIIGLLAVNGIIPPAQAHIIAAGVAQGSGVAAAVGSAPAAAHQAVVLAVRTSFVGGLNQIFLIAAILSFAAAALSLILIRNKDFEASAAYHAAGEPPIVQPLAEAAGPAAELPFSEADGQQVAALDVEPAAAGLAGRPSEGEGQLDEQPVGAASAPDGSAEPDESAAIEVGAAAGAAGAIAVADTSDVIADDAPPALAEPTAVPSSGGPSPSVGEAVIPAAESPSWSAPSPQAPNGSADGPEAPVGSVEGLVAPVGSVEGLVAPVGSVEGSGVPVGSVEGLGVPVGSVEGLGVPVGSVEGSGVPVGSVEGSGAPGGPVESLAAPGGPVESLAAPDRAAESRAVADRPGESQTAADWSAPSPAEVDSAASVSAGRAAEADGLADAAADAPPASAPPAYRAPVPAAFVPASQAVGPVASDLRGGLPSNGAPTPARAGNGRAADQWPTEASAAALAERSYAVALAAEQAQADCSSYIEQILARHHGSARAGAAATAAGQPADDGSARAGELRDRLNHLGEQRRRLVGTLRDHTQAVSEHLRAAQEHGVLSEQRAEDATDARRELYGLIAALAKLTDEARIEATAAPSDPGRSLRAAATDVPLPD